MKKKPKSATKICAAGNSNGHNGPIAAQHATLDDEPDPEEMCAQMFPIKLKQPFVTQEKETTVDGPHGELAQPHAQEVCNTENKVTHAVKPIKLKNNPVVAQEDFWNGAHGDNVQLHAQVENEAEHDSTHAACLNMKHKIAESTQDTPCGHRGPCVPVAVPEANEPECNTTCAQENQNTKRKNVDSTVAKKRWECGDSGLLAVRLAPVVPDNVSEFICAQEKKKCKLMPAGVKESGDHTLCGVDALRLAVEVLCTEHDHSHAQLMKIPPSNEKKRHVTHNNVAATKIGQNGPDAPSHVGLEHQAGAESTLAIQSPQIPNHKCAMLVQEFTRNGASGLHAAHPAQEDTKQENDTTHAVHAQKLNRESAELIWDSVNGACGVHAQSHVELEVDSENDTTSVVKRPQKSKSKNAQHLPSHTTTGLTGPFALQDVSEENKPDSVLMHVFQEKSRHKNAVPQETMVNGLCGPSAAAHAKENKSEPNTTHATWLQSRKNVNVDLVEVIPCGQCGELALKSVLAESNLG